MKDFLEEGLAGIYSLHSQSVGQIFILIDISTHASDTLTLTVWQSQEYIFQHLLIISEKHSEQKTK